MQTDTLPQSPRGSSTVTRILIPRPRAAASGPIRRIRGMGAGPTADVGFVSASVVPPSLTAVTSQAMVAPAAVIGIG